MSIKHYSEFESREALQQDLLDKATDTEFRQALLADPARVLTETYGLNFPNDIKVVVHTEDANNLHLVLPMVESEVELTDEELDGVAGGYLDYTCDGRIDCDVYTVEESGKRNSTSSQK